MPSERLKIRSKFENNPKKRPTIGRITGEPILGAGY
jgi:hypothetical protein